MTDLKAKTFHIIIKLSTVSWFSNEVGVIVEGPYAIVFPLSWNMETQNGNVEKES